MALPQRHVQAEFLRACETGDVATVRDALAVTGEHRVNVHEDRGHALWTACREGHEPVVALLLGLSGDRTLSTSLRGGSVLEAWRRGHEGVVRRLLSLPRARRPCLRTTFVLACAEGEADKVRQLLVLEERFPTRVNLGVQSGLAFGYACAYGRTEVVCALLGLTGARVVDIHRRKEDPLRKACEGGHVDVLRLLLRLPPSRAVDIHAQNDVCFWLVCRRGHMGAVALLVQAAWRRGTLCRLRDAQPSALGALLRDGAHAPWLRRCGALVGAWCRRPYPAGCGEALREAKQLLQALQWRVRGPVVCARTAGRRAARARRRCSPAPPQPPRRPVKAMHP